MADYFPRNEGEQIDWLQNFKTLLPTVGVTLGMTAAEATQMQSDIGNYLSVHLSTEALVTQLAGARANRKAMKVTLLGKVRDRVNKFKVHDAYTVAYGAQLGTVSSGSDFDPNTYKPVITIAIVAGEIRISFKKGGADGVNVYCRLKGTTTWRKLAFDSVSPYVDTEPLANPAVPETREYMARGVIDDAEIGLDSDIVPIVFGG
jgi:hypothetical protein